MNATKIDILRERNILLVFVVFRSFHPYPSFNSLILLTNITSALVSRFGIVLILNSKR